MENSIQSQSITASKILVVEALDLFLNGLVARIPLRILRVAIYKVFLGSCAWSANICRGVKFVKPKNVFLSERVFINSGCILDGRGGALLIGEDVDIGQGSWIWTLEHDPHSNSHEVRGASVSVEDHVWISTRCTIMPGVTLHSGAVVASGAVVTRSVDRCQIVAGVPAKALGIRRSAINYRLVFRTYL